MALMRSQNRQGAHYKDGWRLGLKVSVENGGLLEYFFGTDGKACLQHGRFVQFLRDFHDEVRASSPLSSWFWHCLAVVSFCKRYCHNELQIIKNFQILFKNQHGFSNSQLSLIDSHISVQCEIHFDNDLKLKSYVYQANTYIILKIRVTLPK